VLTPAQLHSTSTQYKTSIPKNPNKNPFPNLHFLASNPMKSHREPSLRNQREGKVGFREDTPTKKKALLASDKKEEIFKL
jgi:hypothetical protein